MCAFGEEENAICPLDAFGVTTGITDEQMASDEGEGDLSLAYWRDVHWEFLGEECATIGKDPSESMPVVCEHFRCIYPLIAAR
jgi:uncharacterized protein YhfF